jgi:16S rRNA (adenine1518-N6/adenine1519-N6)-dimethyltransferase
MLRSSLKSFAGASEAAEQIGIDLQRRAETLSVEEFVEVARALSSSRA